MTEGALGDLYSMQRDSRRRWIVTVAAAIVGLGLAIVHWAGLLLGAALVAWAWPTVGRATIAGLGFALFVLVAFVLSLALAGTLDDALGMGRITLVTGAIPLVLGLLGGVSRGLAPNAPSERSE